VGFVVDFPHQCACLAESRAVWTHFTEFGDRTGCDFVALALRSRDEDDSVPRGSHPSRADSALRVEDVDGALAELFVAGLVIVRLDHVAHELQEHLLEEAVVGQPRQPSSLCPREELLASTESAHALRIGRDATFFR
jgi:hypothetical protein